MTPLGRGCSRLLRDFHSPRRRPRCEPRRSHQRGRPEGVRRRLQHRRRSVPDQRLTSFTTGIPSRPGRDPTRASRMAALRGAQHPPTPRATAPINRPDVHDEAVVGVGAWLLPRARACDSDALSTRSATSRAQAHISVTCDGRFGSRRHLDGYHALPHDLPEETRACPIGWGEAQKPASPSVVLSAQSSMRTEVELDIARILGLEAIIRLLPAWIASRKRRSFFAWWVAGR